MTTHPFDLAIALTAQPTNGPDHWRGHTSPAYANMVGPFGGITVAQALNAVMQHPQRLGEPISLTVNFCAALADGAFELVARAARTNRSTQHWVIDMRQDGQTVLTATAITAVRRSTWSADDEPMPPCPPPAQVPTADTGLTVAWVQRYHIKTMTGALPTVWDGAERSSLTQQWVRDEPARPLDFCSLAAMSDLFFGRILLRRATRVPFGTVSMTAYFHADAAMLARTGSGYLLAQARAHTFRNGYADQTAQLWNEAGDLLVTTNQIVYYKE